jgi:hypothetical protein
MEVLDQRKRDVTGQGQAGDAFPSASAAPALMDYSERL